MVQGKIVFNRSRPRPEPRLDPVGQVLVLVLFLLSDEPGERNQFTVVGVVLVLLLVPFTIKDVVGGRKKNKA